jgi:hypothetical protein
LVVVVVVSAVAVAAAVVVTVRACVHVGRNGQGYLKWHAVRPSSNSARLVPENSSTGVVELHPMHDDDNWVRQRHHVDVDSKRTNGCSSSDAKFLLRHCKIRLAGTTHSAAP